MPHTQDTPGARPDAPGLPAEEGVDLADAEKEAALSPEEKKNRTDGADGTDGSHAPTRRD